MRKIQEQYFAIRWYKYAAPQIHTKKFSVIISQTNSWPINKFCLNICYILFENHSILRHSLLSYFITDSTLKGVRLINFFNFASDLHNICFKIDYSPHLNNFPHCPSRRCLTKKLRHRVLIGAWNSGRDIINDVEEIRAIIYRKQSIFWCRGKNITCIQIAKL